MLIPLDQIDAPARSLRGAVNEAADAALTESIKALGVLSPVLVIANGNRFQLVAGERRLRCARAAGLTEIPAEKAAHFTAGYASAAAAAENMVRRALSPVEQWRAIVAMQEAGSTLAHAAACLGLSEHQTRRMDHLGRLHPDMLALIEAAGMPGDRVLRTIANASPKQQKAAAKSNRTSTRDDGSVYVDWHSVARACEVQRIPRGLAIFDTEKVKLRWDEDLFAEPGSDEQFTTSDVPGFLAAQRTALEAEVAAAKAKKKRIELVEPGGTYPGIELPKGWVQSYGNADKPKREETVFVTVGDGANWLGKIIRITAINPKAEAARAKAKPANPADDIADDGWTDDAPEPATPAEPPLGITKAGLQLIADAKTQALRLAVSAPPNPHSAEMLLLVAILALHGDNVGITGYSRHQPETLARLVSPYGKLDLDEHAIAAVAAEVLAQILGVDGPETRGSSYKCRSGDVAEWIGHALMGETFLDRFDTPEFLATCSLAVLKEAAIAADIKPNQKASALREQLAGRAPAWRPTAAQFGAAGPKARGGEEE